MMIEDRHWITLDYLELFCQRNQLAVGCRHEDDELWISPLGPHPSTLTSDRICEILDDSLLFEIRPAQDRESALADSHFLTRGELESRIRRLMN